MLEIVYYPHPALRYESRPVTRIDEDLRVAVREMFELMYAARGIGLAANQVGLPFQFFVLNLTGDPEQKGEEGVYLNPEVVRGEGTVEEEEGCLSFPGLYGPVKRAKKIRFRAMDLSGRIVEREAGDLFSRAVQHETDHLHGRLFIDHFVPEVMAASAEPIAAIEAGFRRAQAEGRYPTDDEIREGLAASAKANRIVRPGRVPVEPA